MARKKDSPQKAALRELMGNYLKENNVKVKDGTDVKYTVNNPVPVSLLSGDRKPQIRFLGNHHSGSGNPYHKSFRM